MPGGAGNTQIINGQEYTMYSPQWYDAMRNYQATKAGAAGTAVGTGIKSALTALGDISGLTGGLSSSSSTGVAPSGSIPRIGGPTGSPSGGFSAPSSGSSGSVGAIPQISMPNMSAAESAAFGKAKEQVGQEASSALTGLRSALAGRNMLGSGAEARGTLGVVTKGQGELGDVSRAQAENELATNLDVAKTNLGASLTGRGQDITQRGQNIDYTMGTRGQDITQRGQDIQQQEANAQLQLTQSLQQAAMRQQILNGIAGAINGSTLY